MQSTRYSPRALQKELLEFFCGLKPQGFLSCLGIRKTPGSQDGSLPPDKDALMNSFNKLHTPIEDQTEGGRRPAVNLSILTVGARAM